MNPTRKLFVLVGATVVVAAIWPGFGAAAVAPQRAPAPPQRMGTLRIAGVLRDGSIVRAAGLAWRPGRLPSGDRLLSFAVAYTWQSCARRCRKAADSTVTPFAAARYIAGHTDTGRRLRLTETATEVVETKEADFTFVAISSSASVRSRGPVASYRGGHAPRTEFVNGTPERTTGSDAEYFQVDPHYAAGARVPRQWFKVDGGPWRPLPRFHLFYTGPTGKWVGEVEYSADGYVCNPGRSCKGPHRFTAFCRTLYAPGYGLSAMKLDVNLDGATFLPCPSGT